MLILRRIALFLLILPALEVAIFVAVAVAIGFWKATLLSLATSVAGAIVLNLAGQPRLRQFQSSLARGAGVAGQINGPGLFAVVAGLLLLIPGFLTDLLAILLLIPSVRQKFAVMAGGFVRTQQAQTEPGVVDLQPGEWRDEPQHSLPRRQPPESRQP
jgi:UPF0716 protein FxsA